MLSPCQNAMVTRNGEVLRKEVQLNPGDVIGLGQHYLFLFKDPFALTHKVRVANKRDRKVRADCVKYLLYYFYLVKSFFFPNSLLENK